ncbi:MAG: hypothetical protein ACOX4R_07745 [Lentihominibacter sp.]|jgi:hypothetical protein
MKRMKPLIVAVALLLNICGFTAAAAYFISYDSTDNEFRIGYNDIIVEENYKPPTALKPGISFKKTVSIKNVSPNPCVVRVRVDFSDYDLLSVTEIDFDRTNWTEEEDGYWYYHSTIPYYESTSPLFSRVKVSDEVPEYKLKAFNINVYAESKSCNENDSYRYVWGL